jgi:hypothetical protein
MFFHSFLRFSVNYPKLFRFYKIANQYVVEFALK